MHRFHPTYSLKPSNPDPNFRGMILGGYNAAMSHDGRKTTPPSRKDNLQNSHRLCTRHYSYRNPHKRAVTLTLISYATHSSMFPFERPRLTSGGSPLLMRLPGQLNSRREHFSSKHTVGGPIKTRRAILVCEGTWELTARLLPIILVLHRREAPDCSSIPGFQTSPWEFDFTRVASYEARAHSS